MILLKNFLLYGEEEYSLLIAGEKIVHLARRINSGTIPLETIDCQRKSIFPGLIDPHIHLAGAGGEGGPTTRTAPLHSSELISSGITCAIGSLGADSFTRTITNLLYRARELNALGLSAYILSGGYQFPLPAASNDVFEDIILIPEVLGIGEVAVADHRSSAPSTDELFQLISRSRLAAMIAGKSGAVLFHLGDEPEMFSRLMEIYKKSNEKFNNIIATHCNRNPLLFESSKEAGKLFNIDLTTSSYKHFADLEIKPSRAVSELLRSGVPAERITLSSDAGGSLPDFDSAGNLKRIFTADPGSLLTEFFDLIRIEKITPQTASSFVSTNAAEFFKIPEKGKIEPGFDADLILVDENFQLDTVISRGKILFFRKKFIK